MPSPSVDRFLRVLCVSVVKAFGGSVPEGAQKGYVGAVDLHGERAL
jgi:hypothetical protein